MKWLQGPPNSCTTTTTTLLIAESNLQPIMKGLPIHSATGIHELNNHYCLIAFLKWFFKYYNFVLKIYDEKKTTIWKTNDT